MSHQQQIDFYDKKVQELYAELLMATDPEKIDQLVKQIQQYMSAGWGILTEEEKKRSLDQAEEFLEDVNQIAQEKLGEAVDAQKDAIASLIETLGKIDLEPLIGQTKRLTEVFQNLADTAGGTIYAQSHASGLDYVPYDNYSAILHRGEAVLTARGNEALGRIEARLAKIESGGATPVVIEINGDIGNFVDAKVKEGTERTIQIIRRNPRVLA